MHMTYSDIPNRRVTANNGVEYVYRETGDGNVPLVLLQHFRGNLDGWDPALIDALAVSRRVVTFDNVGFDQIDVLGFSIGSFVAQDIALIRPALVRKLVLASSAPQGAAGMHGWAPHVVEAVGKREPNPEGVLDVFYAPTPSSRQAGEQAMQRMLARTTDRDQSTTWETRQAQYDAVCTWGIPNHSLLQRVSAIQVPVFVANGDSDPMILPHYSHLLAGLIPHASVKIYPDSAHGFLFQHHTSFADDVEAFLGGSDD
jgi:pimeloyl-ACP methyl ester carboxylesterase